MKIRDTYTQDVQYVEPSTRLSEVAKLMKQHDCGAILVGENDRLSGMITDRDITLRCVADSKDPTVMTAQQCQTPDVLYCFEDDDVEDTLQNMAENKIRRLPVLNNREEKRLVGIVSFGDLSAACDDKKLSGEAMTTIRKAA